MFNLKIPIQSFKYFYVIIIFIILFGVTQVIAETGDLPDVYIDKVDVVPFSGPSLVDGQKAIMKCLVKRGNKEVPTFHVAFFMGHQLIKEVRVKKNQFISGEKLVQAGFKYNASIADYSCIADNRNIIKESNETNNKMGISVASTSENTNEKDPTTPGGGDDSPKNKQQSLDLAVTKISVDTGGTEVIDKVRCYYKYVGDPVETPWQVEFTARNESIKETVTAGKAELQKGEGYIEIAGFSKYSLKTTDQDMNLKCILDSGNTLTEQNELNNEATYQPIKIIVINPTQPKAQSPTSDLIAKKVVVVPKSGTNDVDEIWCFYEFKGTPIPSSQLKYEMIVEGLLTFKRPGNFNVTKQGQSFIFIKNFIDTFGMHLDYRNMNKKISCKLDTGNDIKETYETNNSVSFNVNDNKMPAFAPSDAIFPDLKIDEVGYDRKTGVTQIFGVNLIGNYSCKWSLNGPEVKGTAVLKMTLGSAEIYKVTLTEEDLKKYGGTIEIGYKGNNLAPIGTSQSVIYKCAIDTSDQVFEADESNNSKQIEFRWK
ncbi:MAG: hypothetical protein JW737_05735 [Acidobacteria bacterium]|nr:hypothetical protein [Acidobacteriota bacterium]